ncbi:4-carboxy-4-hydroxy-2-oxoadipate aldolase/oxaloacetate decarboxylase [Ovoidimarina sediminis]|uniref:4-carboxy-4-hydroxy-2-oxoadipate aldolase/oxaloacetate decarboxylase n=1 Tax=Ovoidimarina sediminis TaxID=3079856 RepID=UPI00290CD87F|nr:4-carboxy-4-hydroxy-2-oxoadipate aldolase/oxaloacetate decarboxylase [Rhodophyticola sp. MJ-SS7]MDU8941786.1 4-carboxy-4-hydroxy-2-oxoadipate aldolase/oxaloacetate decarboxylase [Rhodophyticola sp. MJ-SS7]
MPVVVTDIKRADAEAAASLAEFGVATVHEAQGRIGLMHQRLRPIYKGAAISGTAVTCTLPPGDNWMIHVAAEQCQPGDILVAATIAEAHSGYFGDLLGTVLQARGVRGLIIDAGCRDIADLEKLGFPVWSRSVCAHGTVKETLGDVNVPVSCGDAIVNPGDVIVADDDGVVVVPRGTEAAVRAAAQARIDKEEANRARYVAGELGLDIYNMRERLKAKGLTYITQADWENGA